jgi:hypothetical protein
MLSDVHGNVLALDAFLPAVATCGHPEADLIASFQRGEQRR